MIKKLLIFLIVLIPIKLTAQYDWVKINPLPVSETCVDLHFFNDSVGIIITPNSIVRTTDAGKNWHVSKQFEALFAKDVDWYNSTGIIIPQNTPILISRDNGHNWEEIEFDRNLNIRKVNVFNEDTMVLSTAGSLLWTYDGGTTWEETFFDIGLLLTEVFFLSSEVAFGTYNGGIVKTINGGKEWYEPQVEEIKNGPSIKQFYFISDSIGFAFGSGRDDAPYKTTDRGETWELDENFITGVNFVQFINENVGFCTTNDGDLFKTFDGGFTWSDVTWDRLGLFGYEKLLSLDRNMDKVYFLDENSGFTTGLLGEIAFTSDGGISWNLYSPFYGEIDKMEFLSEDTALILSAQSFYRSVDKGIHWDKISFLEGTRPGLRTLDFDFVSADTGYCIAKQVFGSLYKTMDGGVNWEKMSTGGSFRIGTQSKLTFISSQVGFIWGTNEDFARTTDGGTTWLQTFNWEATQLQFLNDKVGYALISVNNLVPRIYKTIDGGETWEILSSTQNKKVENFQFLDELNGYFTPGNDSLYKTANGGLSWEGSIVNAERDIESIQFYTKNVGYLLSSNSWFFTSNGGQEWEWVNLENSDSKLLYHDDNIFSYGQLGSLYKTSLAPEYITSLNHVVKGESNYKVIPNPAINKIYVETNEQIKKMELFDIKRRKLNSIENQNSLDLSNHPEGMYLLIIHTKEQRVTEKLIKRLP